MAQLEEFFSDDDTEEEDEGFEAPEFSWQEGLYDSLSKATKAAAKAGGYDPYFAEQWFNSQYGGLVTWLVDSGISGERAVDGADRKFTGGADTVVTGIDPFQNPDAFNGILNASMAYLDSQWPGFYGGLSASGSGGRRGGGGGRRGPRMSDFDIEELANGVNDLYRAYVWDVPDDPRGIARAYAESVIANPDQKLDFQTFVEGRIKQTSRYKTMYKNMPKGLSEQAYSAQFGQIAMQVLGGSGGNQDALGRVVAQATALGSTPDAFRGKLNLTREGSMGSGFVGRIRDKLTNVRGVLKS